MHVENVSRQCNVHKLLRIGTVHGQCYISCENSKLFIVKKKPLGVFSIVKTKRKCFVAAD